VKTVQISISARHGHLSEATQEKIRAKAEKVVRLFERLQAIEITVDLQSPNSVAVELLVSAEHKHDFVATESGEDLMGCLDGATHKIEQQLRKYKERVQEHRGPGLRQQNPSET
jgi:putative sigma-54 modulation protein